MRSHKTIESHRQSIGRKLQVSNRVELARIAIREGLAPLSEPGNGESAESGLRSQIKGGRAGDVVHEIEAMIGGSVAPLYYRKLVQAMVKIMQVAGAFIMQLGDDGKTLHVLAAYHDHEQLDEFDMPVEAVPCQHTLERGFWHVDNDLEKRFQTIPDRPGIKLKSYMGVRLNDREGKILGAMMVFQSEQVPIGPGVEDAMRVLAERAANELERTRLIEQLKQRIEELGG